MTISQTLIIASLIAVASLALPPQVEGQRTCSAIELAPSQEVEYNRLLCEGIRSMSLGRYSAAVKAFEAALKESFDEAPNYKLFTRLAVAYFKAGNVEKARDTLAKAEVSLALVIGTMKCDETPNGWVLLEGGNPVAETHGVQNIMCGSIYEDTYRFKSLQSAMNDGKLIEAYLAARQLIPLPTAKPLPAR